MLFGGNWEKFLWEGIIFLTFLLICGGLLETRFSKKASILIGGGTVLGIVLLQAGLLMSGQDTMLVLTMLPLTAYLPYTYPFTCEFLSDHVRLDGRRHLIFPYENGGKAPRTVSWKTDQFARLGL